jgi:hypothetical protein
MDKRSKKRRRKQNKSAESFNLELERLAAQHNLQVADSNDASEAPHSNNNDDDAADDEESFLATEDVDHEALSRATQFLARSQWQVRNKKKFAVAMLRLPLKWCPPHTPMQHQHQHQHQHQQQHRQQDGNHGSGVRPVERGDQRNLVATCMVQIRDARECIFAIRSPAWCQSCLEGISNTLLSLESFGNPLLAQNEDVVVNLRRLLASTRGLTGDALDPVTHVRILCDLDDMYHRCYYHMMTRKDDAYSKSKYPRPIDYLSTTCPIKKTNDIVSTFLKNEMHDASMQETLQVLHEHGLSTQPKENGNNPLLDGLNLRWRETVSLLYDTGLVKDGRMDVASSTEVEGTSGTGSSSNSTTGSGSGSVSSNSNSSSNTTSKKHKKHKRKKSSRSSTSLREVSGPKFGRATWTPIADPVLEIWRHNCRDWLARLYAFAVPNQACLEELAKHTPIVEMGAGTGYWASQLKNMGVDVIAYDIKPPAQNSGTQNTLATVNGDDDDEGGRKKKKKKKRHGKAPTANEYHGETSQFCEVVEGGPETLTQHRQRTLFLCYPPPNDPMARHCLREYDGNTFVYVGEWEGLTADVSFEETVQREWLLLNRMQLPNFGNQMCEMFVFQRRNNSCNNTSTTASSSSFAPTADDQRNHTEETAATNKVAPPVGNAVLHVEKLHLTRCGGCGRNAEEAAISNRTLRRCLYCRKCIYCSKKCFQLCTNAHEQRHAFRCIFFKEKILSYPKDFTTL